MTRDEAHALVDQIFSKGEASSVAFAASPANEITEVQRVLPEGKRVVRTKTSGDRVYLLDDVKKTRAWITTGEILQAMGFEMSDVIDVEDTELMKYNMAPAIYKVPETNGNA